MFIFVLQNNIKPMTNSKSSVKPNVNTPLKRFLCFALSFCFGLITYWTFTGDLQTYVYFPGLLNEIGFFSMGCLCTISSLMMACQD